MSVEEQPMIPSVWTRPVRRRRDQPGLSRAQIVTEAVALLDAEGLEALSMRRLGTRLNAGATSMYSHVANKDELIELVLDEVYGELAVPPVEDPAEWRAYATTCAERLRAMILRHPWTVSVFGQVGVAYLGPNVLRMTEAMMAIFEEAGFPPYDADHAVKSLTGYVTGMATGEAAWLTALARSGLDERTWMERMLPAAREAVRPYPRVSERFDALTAPHADEAQSPLEYGLARLLDGLEARLAEVRG
ncbi:MAG: TetR family transcriptional regulator [Streptomycetaceae bacterium]|nr:TetR family transcriptional regulator [Streptomycetaceae bacterium]